MAGFGPVIDPETAGTLRDLARLRALERELEPSERQTPLHPNTDALLDLFDADREAAAAEVDRRLEDNQRARLAEFAETLGALRGTLEEAGFGGTPELERPRRLTRADRELVAVGRMAMAADLINRAPIGVRF